MAVGKKCFPGGVSVEFKKFMSEKGGTGKVRIDKVKEYWEGKYKGNNKLTRGVVKAFGGKVAAVAKLFKYAVEFGVEGCGGKFVTTIWKAVKGILGGEKPTSQGYIDYVKSVFSEDIGKVNPEAKDAPALTSDQEKGLDKV
ncbi:hypothetical protein [Streptomyces sp. NBRC 110611]|uniref:hypothetical protein n=1 Tax=Streptomyces sp. NBRC 110611 TaxID=1621259 RepID=UPI0011BFC321|nr:hypothetical protein [Streptomyces sp. NBRC 110611]